jgi:hypothetical protein
LRPRNNIELVVEEFVGDQKELPHISEGKLPSKVKNYGKAISMLLVGDKPPKHELPGPTTAPLASRP